MDHIFLLLTLLGVFTFTCEGNAEKDDAKLQSSNRSGRKYDTYYNPPNNFAGDSDDASDSDDDDAPDMPMPPPSRKNPNYGNFKGFDFKPDYPQVYKKYPFIPYWKGSQKGKMTPGDNEDSNTPAIDPLKMTEMMMMMGAMEQLQNPAKDENKGFLSSISPETKSVLMASIIPLSIVLAAVIPVVINYKMTGANLQLVSTTASNKQGRNSDTEDIMHNVLRNFEEIARSIDTDDCFQKALCQVASSNATSFGSHIRKAASTVANFMHKDWVKDARIKNLVSGLKEGNCENVCKSSVSMPRINENY